jgi:hypothetical protein
MAERSSFLESFIGFFIVLGISFIPFSFYFFSYQTTVTDFIFEKPIEAVARLFNKSIGVSKVYSDTTSMYILVLLLAILALLIILFIRRMTWWKKNHQQVVAVFYSISCYYLILILMKYGIGKLFKDQFYLPEPNTLYTPVGQVSKDLLFWTTVGTSYTYNIIVGSIEVLAAMLLFFRTTRLAGLLLALISVIQIVAINFGFDISVKLYSLFLVLIILFLFIPYRKRMVGALRVSKKEIAPAIWPQVKFKNSFIEAAGKMFVAGVILLETFYPYIKTGHYNDDIANRPYLHGAYEVKYLLQGNDTLPLHTSPVKRFFIHRRGYIIFQSPGEVMMDYRLSYDTANASLVLQDYQLRKTTLRYNYSTTDSLLSLQYFQEGKEYRLIGKGLNWRKLPALRKDFHWTVD